MIVWPLFPLCRSARKRPRRDLDDETPREGSVHVAGDELWYVPTVTDLAMLDRLLPGADPNSPPWAKLTAALLKGGVAPRSLDHLTPAAALALLEAAGDPDMRWLSMPDSPTRWAKVFNVSVTTIKRWFADQTVRNVKRSDRSYQVVVTELPRRETGL